MPAPPPTPPPPSEQATKRHKPQLDARARGATTAATYIQAALEALQEHTTGTQATTDAVTNTLQSGHSHLTNALECLQAWTGEGGATGVQLVNNHTEDMEPGGGEEPASSSTRPRGRLAEQRPPSPINNPDSSNPPPPRPAQDNDTTATGGWTHHTGGTTNFEEAIRLAQHVRMGWGALNAEERIQDVGAILGLLRQGRRWLGTVVRTSSWALQSMAEARAPQAEQELLIAASYPTHPQASHHLQQAQHHMEACLGGEASALATQHNREAEGGEVHPADALALAAGGEEAPPGPNPGNQLQPTGHPIVRARHILQRLMPFTGGEVQEQLEAALQALNEWCHNLWGADLLAIEDTRGGSEGAARVGAATRGGHAGEGAAEAGGETNQRDRDLLPDRDNGREKIEAIVTLEAEGGTGGATSSEQGIDGGAPLTPPTQAWQPPPPSSYPQPQTMRRRWEAQMGIAANRRRSKQRRRLAFGQRTRRSRSGGSSYQYKHLTTEAGEEEEDEAGDEDETHRRRRTEPPGGIDLLNVAEEHRRRRAHAPAVRMLDGTSQGEKRKGMVWEWPQLGDSSVSVSIAREKSASSVYEKARPPQVEYDVAPLEAVMDVFLATDSNMHKRIFGAKLLKQYKAVKEILLAGDTNRLVAELTFVRINDLAVPSEPIHILLYLEPLIALIIVANGISIGIQTDPHFENWEGWLYVEMGFVLLLAVELLARILVLGCRAFWCGSEQMWNWFDAFLTSIGVVDVMWQFASTTPPDIVGTLLLRCFRLVRLARVVRVFRLKIMSDLRLMLRGLIAGIWTLALAFLLLFAVLYVIAGLASFTIGKDRRVEELGLREFFYNIPVAMFTTFRCFIGDCNTQQGRSITSLLTEEFGVPFVLGYVASYMLVAMGIFNVILAVYVDITMKAAKENDTLTAEQYSRESVRIARATRELLKKFAAAYHVFHVMGDHGADVAKLEITHAATLFTDDEIHEDVAITKELFLLVIQDPAVQALMDELDLPPSRAHLFEVIDADGSGTLHIQELVQGLLKLRGEVNKGDVVAPLLAARSVQDMVGDLKKASEVQLDSFRAELSQHVQMLQSICSVHWDHPAPERGQIRPIGPSLSSLVAPTRPEAMQADVELLPPTPGDFGVALTPEDFPAEQP
ncbi:Cacna1c [Symbiodinium natans]|uniref:Cacna1c protein n=1 Tax=Symbiodinium natans TaxID=878477 RepID=A0A812K1L6_9DINO|nr:Cacna1c [Symbiodinium natans]